MGWGLGRREEAAGEWRCRRATLSRASAGLRTLPLPPARPLAVLATTSCRGEGPGHKRWVFWTRGWVRGGSYFGGTWGRELLFGGHLSEAGGSKVASRRLLFGESEGCGSLSPLGVENRRSYLWKRGVGQNNAVIAAPVTTHSAPGIWPGAILIVIGQEASDAGSELRVVCRRHLAPFCAGLF